MGLDLPCAGTEPRAEISGFVLAGGRSSRLGRDKVLLPWNPQNGQTLLDHAVGRLRQVCGTVKVCADRADLPQHMPLIQDAFPGAGPLGGMVAALEQSQTEWNLFLAVDLPLVPVEFLQALVARVPAACAACILPQVEGLPQPLCGLYRQLLAPGLRLALQEGKYKVMHAVREAIKLLGPLAPQPEMLDVTDRTGMGRLVLEGQARDWFLNINTAADWEQAQLLASQSRNKH